MSTKTHQWKLIIFTMGGKGGVGKSTVLISLVEWFAREKIACTLLDLDTENKAQGSLSNYFNGTARKVSVHTPSGLDFFLDLFDQGPSVILADMGAGSGFITHDWFDAMHEAATNNGIRFTAIGVVTSDPSSVQSVLYWGGRLEEKVKYLIVENSITSPHADFTYWRDSEQAKDFRADHDPKVISMEYRIPDLENVSRNHGVSLGQVADRKTAEPTLLKMSIVARAQGYQKRLFAEFDTAKSILLP